MKTGDKVVCVDDSPRDNYGFIVLEDSITKGSIYVIRSTRIDRRHGLMVNLIGIRRSWVDGGIPDFGWGHSRFRLLDELKEESRNKHEKPESYACPLCGAAHVDSAFQEKKESPL